MFPLRILMPQNCILNIHYKKSGKKWLNKSKYFWWYIRYLFEYFKVKKKELLKELLKNY